MKGILGKKVGMTQIFDDTGEAIPVTVIEAGPCYVTQIKSEKRDGYEAIQLGFGEAKRLNKPQRGHLPKGVPDLRYSRELNVDDISAYELGQKIDASLFAVGDLVDVTGISKGKGFAGAMKRHGFGGGPITHGQSDRARAPGSIGSTSTPGRVFKGMRMAGHMGHERVTVQNLQVILVDPERNLLAVKGAVPGARGGLVTVKSAVKG
jgi:large subunit ribosomal protein L3